MMGEVNITAVGVVAFVVMIAAWCLFFMALNPPRRRSGQPGPVVPIVEEAATATTLAPWSPTRGFYWFAADQLPEVYLTLNVVSPAGAEFKEFGEDEAGALAALNIRLARKFLDVTGKVAPPITSTATRFKPLNKRKARTP